MYHKVTPNFPMKQALGRPKNKKPLGGSVVIFRRSISFFRKVSCLS